MITTAGEIIEKSYEAAHPWSTILDQAEQALFMISQTRLRKEFMPIKDVLRTTFEIIEELYEHKRAVTGVESGFEDLDRLTAGFQKSDLIIIAGRPSMGKTSLMLNMAEHAAIKKRLPVGVFSLEMSKEQVVQRFLCSQARIPAQRLRTGFLKESEWPKLTDAAAHLSEAPIFIDDTPAISTLDMRARARRLKSEHDIALIIIDYLQLARCSERAENRQQEISSISRSLKALAKELSIPIIALSQLSRAVEARGGDRRPMLSDLRESGAIEQDADLVLFLYRAEFYDPDDPDKQGKAELIIGKQRNGPTGIVPLVFEKRYTRFYSAAQTDAGGQPEVF
jgi:replicative DNA helicase